MSALSIWLIAFLYVAGAAMALELTTRGCTMQGVRHPKWAALAVLLIAWPLISAALALYRVATDK